MKKIIIRLAFLTIFAIGAAFFINDYAYAFGCDGCATHDSEKFCITCSTGETDCTNDSGHPRCSKGGESD